MKSTVIIRFEIEGFHNYPNAPKEVEFLSNQHRHTFVVKCGYKVKDLNREREIFICREQVKKYIDKSFGTPCQFNAMSCEMIATEILQFGIEGGMVWCSIWEENTGGAKVEL